MSGSIENSDNSKIGDTSLETIMAEIKSKWNTKNFKTERVAYLREGLINHITGLKESMTKIFKDDKPLGDGQMLLFDTANRKVTFNTHISDQYKALDTNINVFNNYYKGIEYILVNPRLVLTSKVEIEPHKHDTLKKMIKERIAKNPSENLIHSIGINWDTNNLKYTIVNRVNSKDNLPMFDEDITVLMLGDYKGPDVSIGVNRGNFDYDNTMNNKLRTMYTFIDTPENNGENVVLNSVLKNYKQQITDQYNTISSLFTGENVPKDKKYIYNVLTERPNIKVDSNIDNKIRKLFDYCIFRWMELYYEFYEFCLQHQPIKQGSKRKTHTIRDPLNRFIDTLEYRIYKYQTDGIKLFLLYLFFDSYDNDNSSKQIYTPEMLLYDIGRIIETPPTHRKSSKTLPENLSRDAFFRRQSRTSSEGSNSSRRDSSRRPSTDLTIENLEDVDGNSLPNVNSPQSNIDTSRSNSVSSSPQASARSWVSSRGSESGKNLELNSLPNRNNRGNESDSLDTNLNNWTNPNQTPRDDELENHYESEDAQSVDDDSSRSSTPINVAQEKKNFNIESLFNTDNPADYSSPMNNNKASTSQRRSVSKPVFKQVQQLARPYKPAQQVQKQPKQLHTQKHVNGPNV